MIQYSIFARIEEHHPWTPYHTQFSCPDKFGVEGRMAQAEVDAVEFLLKRAGLNVKIVMKNIENPSDPTVQ